MANQLYVGSTGFYIVSHDEGEKLMCVCPCKGVWGHTPYQPPEISFPVNDSR